MSSHSGKLEKSGSDKAQVSSSDISKIRHFEAALNSTKDYVYVFDLDGTYSYINDAFAQRFLECMGLESHDVLGKRPQELGYSPDVAKRYQEQLKEVIATGRPVRAADSMAVPDGEIRQLESMFTPVFGQSGEVEAVAGVTRDVTEFKETAAALAESETLYKTIFESVDQGIGLVEMIADGDDFVDFRWLQVNEAFEKQSGLGNPVGKTGSDYCLKEDQNWFELYAATARSGEAQNHEMYADITGKWFDVHTVPVGDETNQKVAVLFTEITARKRREQNTALLDELNDDFARLTCPDDIMDVVGEKLADHLDAGRVNFWSVDADEGTLQTLYDWHRPGMKSAGGSYEMSRFMNERFLEELRRGEPVAVDDIEGDERTTSKVAAFRDFEVKSTLHVPHLSDGSWKFMLTVDHSRSHQWRADEIDLVCDLTARLWWRLERARSAEALREANRRKDHFLGVLSHELRNPLAPIELSLRLLDSVDVDSDAGRKARTIIDRQVKQLTRLVDDLLDVTRIDRDKILLDFEHLELNELAYQTVEDHRPLFDEKDVELSLVSAEEPVYVRGDRNRLAQVLGNLLQNAAKFTETGDQTQVSIEADRSKNQVELRVADTGVGMDEETLARLFDPFVQADSTLEHSVGGLGLGLALVKGLVDLHDGEVVVTSDGPGAGSEFVVRLRLEPAYQKASKSESSDESKDTFTIVMIEDNEDIAESLQAVLEIKGHRVDCARTGPAGLELVRRVKPQVVICDIGLPGMNGFEVARQLRLEPELSSVHLIALSGYARPADIEKAQKAGFDHHLAKPPNLVELDAYLDTIGDDQV